MIVYDLLYDVKETVAGAVPGNYSGSLYIAKVYHLPNSWVGREARFTYYIHKVTTAGFRLKGTKEIKASIEFEFKVDLPVEMEECTVISFRATSKWCKKYEGSRYFETGFEILDCNDDETAKIKALIDGDLFSSTPEKLHISLSMMGQ